MPDIWISDKKVRDSLLDMNSVMKNVYPVYQNHGGVIMPLSLRDIKDFEVFQNSIMVYTGEAASLEFMDGCIVDQALLSKALRSKGYSLKTDKNGHHKLFNDKKEEFEISSKCPEHIFEDSKHYLGLHIIDKLAFDLYPMQWDMDDETKDALLRYAVPVITLGEHDGEEVKLIGTVKLFPAIKKAKNIRIYTKFIGEDYDDKLYEILIVSTGTDWTFYSKHIILNF